METAPLKRFAQRARRDLLEQVATRLELVLQPNSAARRENPAAIKQIDQQLATIGKDQLIDKVAYTWFNRFCALRYMDVNRVNRIGVVSPIEEQVQPEILAEAKMGHMDVDMVSAPLQGIIGDLLGGRATSLDPQGEAYRLLVVAACNHWHTAMPFLFERIADYTELLMPDDLLSGNSILADVRAAMTVSACQDVEVIGWLYQFYISEKKDAVFDGMKKGKKITPDNIPAATQLFTPHWIVRYLLENSLGRLWMLNHPDSKLIEQMEYYIRPEQAETDFLRIDRPEDIKVCDPACGSGHMLTYAFDLLYAIYEETGTDASEIPGKILTHNLYGIEIDERAGDLAAFALSMKARAKQRRFFSQPIEPNICALDKVNFSSDELDAYMEAVGRDLFTLDLRETLKQFEEADNFGSLIRPTLTNAEDLLPLLEVMDLGGQLFLQVTHDKVLKVLRQAEHLRSKYQVVVANPPYMGGRGMNPRLAAWLKTEYLDFNSDLFSAFVLRCSELGVAASHVGIMSPNVWMYISSHERLRELIVDKNTLNNLVELPLSGFKGATVQICAYNFEKSQDIYRTGSFISLVEFRGGDYEMAAYARTAICDPSSAWAFVASPSNFKKIPGYPIAFGVNERVANAFRDSPRLEGVAPTRKGMVTARNTLYVREWHEVSADKAGFDKFPNRIAAQTSGKKWFSYLKGGGYRKWYGNKLDFVNWENDGESLQSGRHPTEDRVWATNFNLEFIFKPNVNWGAISSSDFSARMSYGGELFDAGGSACFPRGVSAESVLGFLNSKVSRTMLRALNPTLNFQAGNVSNLPLLGSVDNRPIVINVRELIEAHRIDWNEHEISWDFSTSPLLATNWKQVKVGASYQALRDQWRKSSLQVQHLEEANNEAFIEAYKLQDELSCDVSLDRVTLTCNPHYRYGGNKTEAELEILLLADTMREFISYAVGCMFGRYSLDKPGLVLANQGDTLADYMRQVPQPTFTPDTDNVIPLLDGEWFNGDITERFRSFLRLTFGEAHYAENLQFIEGALGKDIRKFFLKDFYNDHVKRYKKRPIYWLFSSPKGSFNALVYLHRYRADTVSVVLQYLRDFQEKLTGERKRQEQISISTSASAAEKTRALKSIDSLKKTLTELDEYERDVLHPLATQQIAIDLDDGVKANYPKFGAALKKIVGLEAKGEE